MKIFFSASQTLVVVQVLFGLVLASGGDKSLAQEFDGRFESKIHYRMSDDNRFPVQFPFPASSLPVGESAAFLETVDAGNHGELSTLNLAGQWQFERDIAVNFKLDIIDKYDRNPTSSDYKFDLDHGFIRWGNSVAPLAFTDATAAYAQVGKFAKFERQRARRTESYGLVSTAFNRFEDSGIEFGVDLPIGVYGKLSWTTGNPVFIRDPNMLAGDNGTSERRVPPNNPEPKLKSGIVILYDAEIERFELNSDSELGAGLGYRWRSRDQSLVLNLLAFGYERQMQQERSLNGTFYGADLDLLDLGEVPGAGGIRLPVEGDDKREYGVNLWFNVGNFASFTQYVEQNMSDLGRTGLETELSYVWQLGLPVTPVVRYSSLSNDFVGHPAYPAPSVWWDWKKFDYGINVDLTDAVRLTAEYSQNRFVRGGKTEENNEAVLTLRWQQSIRR